MHRRLVRSLTVRIRSSSSVATHRCRQPVCLRKRTDQATGSSPAAYPPDSCRGDSMPTTEGMGQQRTELTHKLGDDWTKYLISAAHENASLGCDYRSRQSSRT